MRIEINQTTESSLMGYMDHLESFLDRSDQVIGSFKTVQNSTASLNGGVGNLSLAMDDISARINAEEQKKANAEEVLRQSEAFAAAAEQADQQVAVMVDQNRDQFYCVNPHLMPPATEEEKNFLEQAFDYLKEGFRPITDAFEALGDTLAKGWEMLTEFYEKHKKVIDTVLAVVGAALAIAALFASGTFGLALVPLLHPLLTGVFFLFGASAATAAGAALTVATVISIGVAVLAGASTIYSMVLNIEDIWLEIDDPAFQKKKKNAAMISGILNFAYSLGNIYNSLKGVPPKEYIARQKAIQNGRLGYGELAAQHPNIKVEEGRVYTKAQKDAIYKENMRRNNGELRDDVTGKILQRQERSVAGYKKPLNGSEIDHIFAKLNGGSNSFENARVINWKTNLTKSDNMNISNSFYIDLMPDHGSFTQAISNLFKGNLDKLINNLLLNES